jgi:multiple sugar transport system permease protein
MSLTFLEPIFWLLGVAGLYAVLGMGIVFSVLSLHLKKLSALGAFAAGVALYFGVIFRMGLANAFVLVALSGVGILIEFLLYRSLLAPHLDWQAHKYRKETARQTTLHLILLSGSLLFVVPFVWLVVTSLKEEKEMSAFPPVWIPTQQVKTAIDGQARGLATLPYQGKSLKIAVMQEFDTGDRLVRVLEPADMQGKELKVKKGDFKEIRTFNPVWQNYPNALKFLPPETRYGVVYLLNTLQVSALSIIGSLLSASMVAYSFARLKWPGRDGLFMVLLATMMLPAAVTMMPVFLIFRAVGWVDTLFPLWVPSFFGSAFNIFLLRQFFMGIPTELEEAARIDGCSFYGIFWRIVLPQVKPALAALTIMSFMASWNDFRGPLIYISSPEKQPIAYALQLFQTARGGEPGLLMAASTMVMIPVLLLFFFTQRYFIQGITLTGIKG